MAECTGEPYTIDTMMGHLDDELGELAAILDIILSEAD
jgi:hypothetical protein